MKFEIPDGEAIDTLKRAARQAGHEIMFPAEAVRGVRTHAVQGEFTPFEALNLMVANTVLTVVRDDESGALAVMRRSSAHQNSSTVVPPPGRATIETSGGAMKRTNPIALFFEWLGIGLAPPDVVKAAADNPPGSALQTSTANSGTGVITGQISNAATKDYLEGAVVQIAGTNQMAVTDREGRYAFSRVPASTMTVSANYSGLDLQQATVTVGAGQRVVRDFSLTSAIYTLDRFVVAGEREGAAKAEMLQRAAPNVKNIISADSFGNHVDANIANVLENVAGMNVNWNDMEARNVSIRGTMRDTTTLTWDGQAMAFANGRDTREIHFDSTSVGNVERIEITKAATPDVEGASVGGNINLVTRSAFDRSPGRVVQYSLGLTHQPTFRAWTPHWQMPIEGFGPIASLSFSDTLGEKKNIGVTFTASYHNQQHGFPRAIHTHGLSTATPGPTPHTGFIRSLGVHTRTKLNLSGKIDYRWSDKTVVSFSTTYAWGYTAGGSNRYQLTFPANIATVDASGNRTGGGFIHPNFADGVTRVFASPNSVMAMSSSGGGGASATKIANSAVRHRFDGLDIDYAVSYSFSEALPEKSSSAGGVVTQRLTNFGVNIDRRGDAYWPVLTQTSGPDMYDLNNYNTFQFSKNIALADSRVLTARLDVKKNLPFAIPTFLKTGLTYTRHTRRLGTLYNRYNYVGPDGVEGLTRSGRDLAQFLDRSSPWLGHSHFKKYFVDPNGSLPMANPFSVAKHVTDFPHLWRADSVFNLQNTLLQDRDLTEEIGAAYLMGNVRLGLVSALGGLRLEETRDDGEGPLTHLSPEEIARRATWVGTVTEAESLRRIQAQYGSRARSKGKYTSAFPSLHLKYEPFDRFVTRLSWSVGIGRPSFGSIIPLDTVNDQNETVTRNNPSLKPQFTDSYDLAFEYYFKSQGMASIGVFRKDIRDFIYTDSSQTIAEGRDNGYDGEYSGYRLVTQGNRGSAVVEGLEISVQKQLTFLPGWARGFGINGSFTALETRGDFGLTGTTGINNASNQIARSFNPRTGAFGLTFRGFNFEVRLSAVYRGEYIYTPSANPGLVEYADDRLLWNWKSKYNISRRYSLFFDVENLTREPLNSHYHVFPDRPSNHGEFFPRFQGGVMGRF